MLTASWSSEQNDSIVSVELGDVGSILFFAGSGARLVSPIGVSSLDLDVFLLFLNSSKLPAAELLPSRRLWHC
jgi:hypothetical protein